jgi:hypothetical protein
MNPSTKRLPAVKVKRAGNCEAQVATTEYWYLKWWGTREMRYVRPYCQTSRQLYVLHKEAEIWRVYDRRGPSFLHGGVRRGRGD